MLLTKKKSKYPTQMFDWWGYLHQNGKVQVKVYHSIDQLHDAQSSPFVKMIVNPFKAATREEALLITSKKIEDARKRNKQQ